MSLTTHSTLLARMCDPNERERAWKEFNDRYQPVLRKWCRGKVPPSEVEAVVQEVLMALVTALGDFKHEGQGTLRRWLRTIAVRKCADFLRGQKRPKGRCVQPLEVLGDVAAAEDLQDLLTKAYERELAEQATAAVRERVDTRVFQAYWLTDIEGKSSEEAARQLDMSVNTLYVYRHRVRKLLAKEREQLENDAK